jgi:hypothetical protein
MLARLGNVLYWAGCMLAALSITIAWINYPGVDTTGIEAARQRGLSDASIVQQRIAAAPSATPQAYETAAKAGYSPTEILDHLVITNRSRLAGLPDLQQNPILVMAGATALLAWAVGRALRYVLAGT